MEHDNNTVMSNYVLIRKRFIVHEAMLRVMAIRVYKYIGCVGMFELNYLVGSNGAFSTVSRVDVFEEIA